MISKKMLVGFTIVAAVIVSGLGMCLCRGDSKPNLVQPQSSAEKNKPKIIGVMQRLIMQMQGSMASSENSVQPEAEADANQRVEDEQQWQVLDEKRQARIDRLRAHGNKIEEAVAARDEASKEQPGE